MVKPGTQLDQLGFTRGYLREEIDWVIKGRGLVELAAYLDLPRSGRGTPLHAEARKQAWALYEAYQHELRVGRSSTSTICSTGLSKR